MHKVCVVVPVYKTEENLLRHCIESLMVQSLVDIEIILVDDGSPDKCGDICDEYAEIDSRIKVIHKTNEGVSVARNVGIDRSNSKYISFVDADDWIDINTFEIAYGEAEKDHVDILQWTYFWHCGEGVIGGNAVFNHSGILNKEEHEEYILKAIIDVHPLFSCNKGFAAGAPWAKLYLADFLRNNKLYFVPGLARSQDRIFNLYAYEAANIIKYIDKPFSHYIANNTSAVVSFRSNIESVYSMYLKKIYEFISEKRKNDPIFQEAYKICICYVIQQIFTQYLFNPKNQMKLRDKYKQVKRISNDVIYSIGINNCDNVASSLTNKQKAILKVLKSRLFFVATLAMEANFRYRR